MPCSPPTAEALPVGDSDGGREGGYGSAGWEDINGGVRAVEGGFGRAGGSGGGGGNGDIDRGGSGGPGGGGGRSVGGLCRKGGAADASAGQAWPAGSAVHTAVDGIQTHLDVERSGNRPTTLETNASDDPKGGSVNEGSAVRRHTWQRHGDRG